MNSSRNVCAARPTRPPAARARAEIVSRPISEKHQRPRAILIHHEIIRVPGLDERRPNRSFRLAMRASTATNGKLRVLRAPRLVPLARARRSRSSLARAIISRDDAPSSRLRPPREICRRRVVAPSNTGAMKMSLTVSDAPRATSRSQRSSESAIERRETTTRATTRPRAASRVSSRADDDEE